jgi:hypothetical protein
MICSDAKPTQGDDVSGTFISTINYLAPERISVSGDGSFAFYVTVDNDYGAVNTDASSPLLGGSPGEVHSLAMTRDATQFAYVPLDSQGNALNYIGLIDLTKQTSRFVNLYGLDSEGNRTDIIKYADVLDFTSDGRTLVYDAYSEFTYLKRHPVLWLDDLFHGRGHHQYFGSHQLEWRLQFWNPSIGKADNSLVTFEVVNKTNGISSLVAVDLFSGKGAEVAQLTTAGAFGKPSFTGDDHTIIYSAPNPSANSLYSLGEPANRAGRHYCDRFTIFVALRCRLCCDLPPWHFYGIQFPANCDIVQPGSWTDLCPWSRHYAQGHCK